MKKQMFISVALFVAAFYVAFQGAGWGRERYVLAGLGGMTVFEGGMIELAMPASPFTKNSDRPWVGDRPFFRRAYDDYEIELHEHVEYEDDLFRTGWTGMHAEVHEGGWIDCQFGRCGKIVVHNFMRTSLERPDQERPRPFREPPRRYAYSR